MIDLTALLDPFRNAVSKYLPDDYNQLQFHRRKLYF